MARGQGQGQGHKKISRPRARADPLEAKATDASVLKKEKGLQKFFSGDLKKKVFKNFFFRRSLLEETKKKVFADFP